MVERDQEELFTVCLDDDGHPVQRTVADMTPDEVSTAIDTSRSPDGALGRTKSWPDCCGSSRKNTPLCTTRRKRVISRMRA